MSGMSKEDWIGAYIANKDYLPEEENVPINDVYVATDFIDLAKQVLAERANERDVKQERSMAKIVKCFNSLTDYNLSVSDGWLFMVCLKLARGSTKFNEDDVVDGINYMALYGEERCNDDI